MHCFSRKLCFRLDIQLKLVVLCTYKGPQRPFSHLRNARRVSFTHFSLVQHQEQVLQLKLVVLCTCCVFSGALIGLRQIHHACLPPVGEGTHLFLDLAPRTSSTYFCLFYFTNLCRFCQTAPNGGAAASLPTATELVIPFLSTFRNLLLVSSSFFQMNKIF